MRGKRILVAILLSMIAASLVPGIALAKDGELVAASSVAIQPAQIQGKQDGSLLGTQASSSAGAVATNSATTAGGITFATESYYESGRYKYRLVMSKGGKRTKIASDVRWGFVTDSHYVYYSKCTDYVSDGKSRCVVFRYDTRTGKKAKLATGINLDVKACSGKYLYIGVNNLDIASGSSVYALDTETGSSRHLCDGVGQVLVGGGYVLTRGVNGTVANTPIYSFKASGTAKKKIGSGTRMAVKGKRLYYARFKFDSKRGYLFKYYRCGFRGGSKKALTGWTTEYPTKYLS